MEKTETTCCAVCSGRANVRYYYGAYVCASCCVFFRKTIGQREELQCKASGNCKMKQWRFCHKCRLEKCLANGMNPHAIRDSNRSIVRLKDLAISESGSVSKVLAPLSTMNAELSNTFTFEHKSFFDVLQRATLFHKKVTQPFYDSIDPYLLSNEFAVQMHENFETMSANFRNKRHMGQDPNDPEYMINMAKALILWAKSDADFCGLTVYDQMGLIRGMSWLIMVLLETLNSPKMNNAILLGLMRYLVRGDEMTDKSLFDEVLPRLYQLLPDSTEIELLYSIAFWNAEICSMESKHRVARRRVEYLQALEYYVRSKDCAAPSRHAYLLLLLNAYQKHCDGLPKRSKKALVGYPPIVEEVFLRVT